MFFQTRTQSIVWSADCQSNSNLKPALNSYSSFIFEYLSGFISKRKVIGGLQNLSDKSASTLQ